MNHKIPCHIVAGMLGSGKTTAILEFLHRRKDREFTAVIVNDFGPNGIDSSVLSDTDCAPKVVNVSGGCLCCSSTADFREAFRRVIRLPTVDRIIIEPSGVVLLDALVQTMEELAKDFPVELRPVILMAEPATFNLQHRRGIQYGERLIERAGVVAVNFSDVAAPHERDEFLTRLRTEYPTGKRILSTSFARLPDDVFEPDSKIRLKHPVSGNVHVSDHSHYAGGLQLDPGLVFDPGKLEAVIKRLACHGIGGAAFSRFKGIFQTSTKPMLFEIANGRACQHALETVRGNTLDWITDRHIDAAAVQQCIQQECAIFQPVQPIFRTAAPATVS